MTVTDKVHRLIMMRFLDNWTFCTIYFLEHCIIPILAMICILLMCENSNYFPPCLFIFSSENLKFYQPWNQKSFETDMHPPGNKFSEISKKKVHSLVPDNTTWNTFKGLFTLILYRSPFSYEIIMFSRGGGESDLRRRLRHQNIN